MQANSLEEIAKNSGGFLNAVFTFIYSIAHVIGVGMVRLFGTIFPAAHFPKDLVDPLGFLAVLTIFAILLSLFKKIAWIILALGWILILVRIVMLILGK
jgi:hypothetical protein